MGQAMYVQTVPNSHSFGSLQNILTHYEFRPEELTKEYLLIGFKNCIEREYELKLNGEPRQISPHFDTIQEIIDYLEQSEFNLENFLIVIKNTLANNIDLKCKRKMERRDVYKRIDTERDYQDLRWSPRREKNGTPDEQKPPAEWINYMEYHLSAAKNAVYHLDTVEALAQVRKVAALAVRCLELHGCPERVIPVELLNEREPSGGN